MVMLLTWAQKPKTAGGSHPPRRAELGLDFQRTSERLQSLSFRLRHSSQGELAEVVRRCWDSLSPARLLSLSCLSFPLLFQHCDARFQIDRLDAAALRFQDTRDRSALVRRD